MVSLAISPSDICGTPSVSAMEEEEDGDTFVPSSNDLSDADLGLEGLAAVSRRVELLAVLQRPHVVHGHRVSLLGEVLPVARLCDFLCDAHPVSCGVGGGDVCDTGRTGMKQQDA